MISTVLFDLPQAKIASPITDRMARASDFSSVTGFATPGGVASICGPIRARPQSLKTLVVGATTVEEEAARLACIETLHPQWFSNMSLENKQNRLDTPNYVIC